MVLIGTETVCNRSVCKRRTKLEKEEKIQLERMYVCSYVAKNS